MPNKLQSPVFWPVEERITASEADTAAALVAATDALVAVVARTATADGTGTGTIATGAKSIFVTVTCDDANKIIILPAPTVGTTVVLRNGATGYELRSSDPATVGINGGTGSAAESAIGANVQTRCVCGLATSWICSNFATTGALSTTEVAAP